MTFDLDVDARGVMCPLPLLRLKKALQSVPAGQVVRIQATDPASILDFGVFVERAGHEMLQHQVEDGIQWYWIRKG